MEQDIDYYGNDIVNQVVESIQACAEICASTEGGQFWTWNRENKICFVKRSNSGRKNDARAVSGSRLCARSGDKI